MWIRALLWKCHSNKLLMQKDVNLQEKSYIDDDGHKSSDRGANNHFDGGYDVNDNIHYMLFPLI